MSINQKRNYKKRIRKQEKKKGNFLNKEKQLMEQDPNRLEVNPFSNAEKPITKKLEFDNTKQISIFDNIAKNDKKVEFSEQKQFSLFKNLNNTKNGHAVETVETVNKPLLFRSNSVISSVPKIFNERNNNLTIKRQESTITSSSNEITNLKKREFRD